LPRLLEAGPLQADKEHFSDNTIRLEMQHGCLRMMSAHTRCFEPRLLLI
jgi:hypothetical protein